MTTAEILPHVNAALNAISTVLIVLAFLFIRARRIEAHKKTMVAALVVSALFLVGYVIHRFHAPIFKFPGEGAIVPVYYFILITHVVLAMVITPLVAMTVLRAWRGQFDRHRAIARWTLPLWLYVTVTGVVVYWMLYQVNWTA